MQPCSPFVAVMAVLSGIAATGCGTAPASHMVEYGAEAPIGRWQADDSQAGGASSQPSSAGTGVATPSGGVSQGFPGNTTAGTGSAVPSGAAGRASASGGSGAGRGAAASGGSGATGAMPGTAGNLAAGSGGAGASSGLTSLSFDVMTASLGGRYQPRNIGAIWIQDSSARFVKSLEVWAGIRARYLTKYSGARGGMAVDVTASATLSSHRMHHATWNLKDRSGASVPAGKYTLFIELTDADATGKFTSVDFDTSLGPQTITPPNATGYSAMTLQLQ
jgi:hypothetical protein